ncbi:MAG: hypothetical protein A2X51_06565 [Candidatus Rokubacteria bacterium GWC2_70_24]|nr:MAG: hypothetical protein A2X53_15445 [Candidatus Rokubacteria bacterium GWA2_70_23]OGK88982.1 MAG: hypothetical protein A2X51_06565 [Candidatus Rokubacteria bacterium GWC2_70_24]
MSALLLLLATTYAGGLRVSEVIALTVTDLDRERMTIRVEPGKGGKDRYVPLADRLLVELRRYWKLVPPAHWLFPNRQGTRPIDITVAQKIYISAGLYSLRSRRRRNEKQRQVREDRRVVGRGSLLSEVLRV